MQTSIVHGINLTFPRGNLKKKKRKAKEKPYSAKQNFPDSVFLEKATAICFSIN